MNTTTEQIQDSSRDLLKEVAEFEKESNLKAICGYDLDGDNLKWWQENGWAGVARSISLNKLALLNHLYGLLSPDGLKEETGIVNDDLIGIKVVGRDKIEGLCIEMGSYNEHGIVVDDIDLYGGDDEPEMVITFNVKNNRNRVLLIDYAKRSE